MENFDIFKFILPEEFVFHFDLINIETEGEQLIFSLDEKNVKPPEHSNKELASKGFIESVKIFDFPIRGKGVVLIVRRRKWKDKKTRKTYTRNWKLKEKGTSYNKEFAAFLKEIIDNNLVSASSVAKFYCINGSQLAKQYKNHLSKYNEWDQLEHSEQWILYPNNMGETLCLDEIALSNGELYTILTNAKTKTQKGSLIAMVKGVKSENILKILNRIPISLRRKVKEINTYMANTMGKVAKQAFPNAVTVTDRFYVAKLVSDALQEIRNKHRWKAIYLENKEIETAKKTKIKYVSPLKMAIQQCSYLIEVDICYSNLVKNGQTSKAKEQKYCLKNTLI